MGSAMWTYDLTGGLRISKIHKRIKAEQAIAHLPTMRADRLDSAYLYYDAQADDARLTLTIARTAEKPRAYRFMVGDSSSIGLV